MSSPLEGRHRPIFNSRPAAKAEAKRAAAAALPADLPHSGMIWRDGGTVAHLPPPPSLPRARSLALLPPPPPPPRPHRANLRSRSPRRAPTIAPELEPLRIPRVGDADYWTFHRADRGMAGWSDTEVIGTIWPREHPDAVRQAAALGVLSSWRQAMIHDEQPGPYPEEGAVRS